MRVFFLFFIVLMSAPALAEPEFRVDRDTVFWEDVEANEEIWSFRHAGISLDKENKPEHPIQGPIQIDGRWYYSVDADVLEVDPEAARIVSRTHYSMPVVDLRSNDDRELEVVVSYDDDAQNMVFVHSGESPGRGFWQDGIRTSFRGVRDVTAHFEKKEWETSAEDRASVVGNLRSGAERDLTNPFYFAYLGRFAHLDRKESKADEYFASAMKVEAPWFDKIRLCGMLHAAKRTDLANEACTGALEAMKAEKIRPDAMFGLVTFVATTSDFREAMEQAVEAKKYATADAIAEDMYRLFPRVEGAIQAWRDLADWLESEEKPVLASKWRARSLEVENSPITQAFWGGARTVDRMLLVTATVLLLLPLAGVLIGLRTSRRKPGVEGAKKWIPRPSVAEVVSIVVVLSTAIFAGHQTAKHITMISEFASFPIPLLSEGFGSPEAVTWLEEQSARPARDELLSYGRYEQEQAQKGAALERKPPARDAIIRVVERDSREQVWDEFLESGSFKILERAASIGGSSSTPTPPLGLPALIVFLFFLFVGTAVSRVVPEFSRRAGWFIPGGSSNAGWATPWVLGAFIGGGLWAFTPMGTILRSIALPNVSRYFGLEEVSKSNFLMSDSLGAWLPWTLFFGAILAHAALVFLDRRSLETGE